MRREGLDGNEMNWEELMGKRLFKRFGWKEMSCEGLKEIRWGGWIGKE